MCPLSVVVLRPRSVACRVCSCFRLILVRIASVGLLGGLLLVGIEVVEEQVVVLYTVFKMVDNFLLFVDLDAEASPVIENVLIVIIIELAAQTATTSYDQLPLCFKSFFHLVSAIL